MKRKDQEVKLAIIEALDNLYDSGGFDDFNCWFGPQQKERMADAVMAVLLSTREAQEMMHANELAPMAP